MGRYSYPKPQKTQCILMYKPYTHFCTKVVVKDKLAASLLLACSRRAEGGSVRQLAIEARANVLENLGRTLRMLTHSGWASFFIFTDYSFMLAFCLLVGCQIVLGMDRADGWRGLPDPSPNGNQLQTY